MKNELDVLQDVAGKLETMGVEYYLTGSFAMSFFTLPRMTRDVDLVARLKPGDAPRLEKLFAADYYLPDADSLREVITRGSSWNLLSNATGIKVDVMPDHLDPTAMSRRSRLEMEGGGLWIIALEDLILAKLAWSKESRSALQAGDIRNLLGRIDDPGAMDATARLRGLYDWLEEIRRG